MTFSVAWYILGKTWCFSRKYTSIDYSKAIPQKLCLRKVVLFYFHSLSHWPQMLVLFLIYSFFRRTNCSLITARMILVCTLNFPFVLFLSSFITFTQPFVWMHVLWVRWPWCLVVVVCSFITQIVYHGQCTIKPKTEKKKKKNIRKMIYLSLAHLAKHFVI